MYRDPNISSAAGTKAQADVASSTGSEPSPSNQPDNLNIAIIGAGLSGVLLALSLASKSIRTTLYESAPSTPSLGVGMIIGPNAARCLELLGSKAWTAYQETVSYHPDPARSKTWIVHRYGQDSRRDPAKRAGDLIRSVEYDAAKVGLSEGSKTYTAVHRARFLESLVNGLPDGVVKFGKTLVEIEDQEEAGIQLTFSDGEKVQHSAVVGSDGIRSRTRKILYPDFEPSFCGHAGYRALLPVDVVKKVLGDDRATTGHIYSGYGGFIITYPVEDGKLINTFATKYAKTWDHSQWIHSFTREHMLQEFEDWDPKLVELLTHYEQHDKWAVFDVPLDKPYAKGKVCLIGDSAHAAGPFLGAGAGMAFEDAYVLSNLLEFARDRGMDIKSTFLDFDNMRRPRNLKHVYKSRMAGLANEFLSEELSDDHEVMARDLQERNLWIWEGNLEERMGEYKRAKLA